MVETSGNSKKVRFVCMNGEFVEIDRDATELIGLVREMVESCDGDFEFPVPE